MTRGSKTRFADFIGVRGARSSVTYRQPALRPTSTQPVGQTPEVVSFQCPRLFVFRQLLLHDVRARRIWGQLEVIV